MNLLVPLAEGHMATFATLVKYTAVAGASSGYLSWGGSVHAKAIAIASQREVMTIVHTDVHELQNGNVEAGSC